MKIVVLGGAGDMGAEAVHDLYENSRASEIIIADKNTRAARKLADTLDPERITVREVDATSHESLVNAMAGSTVVAGALGPFYRFERPIVEACLEAGANYVSICDYHDAVESVLELDDKARILGRRILTGLGWTPGLSNLLARRGYDQLEQVDTINIYWAGSAGDSHGLAVILHLFHIFTGKVTSYQNSRYVAVKAGSDKEGVAFPDPLGKVNTFHLGHPEPITIPRYLRGINEVTLKGGLAENYINTLARFFSALGLTGARPTRFLLSRLIKLLLPVFPVNKKRSVSGIRVDLDGTNQGAPAAFSYAAIAPMRRLTGIPLSIGVNMMAENKIARFGVFGPEADNAVDSKKFIEELEKRGVTVETRNRT